MKKSIQLFCLPFAGGNKYSYREYIEKAPAFLKLMPLEYPGRGARMKEPLISDVNEMVTDLFRQIKSLAEKNDYAIYGHSMGGLLAYLLTVRLLENKIRSPLHLFITGTTGPSASSRQEKIRHNLNKREFMQEIKDLKGMPDEILENEEMLEYFEPILRSDFQASENYVYTAGTPLNVPITVITGTEEDMEKEDIELWQKESDLPVDFKRFPGNHFFIFQYPSQIIEIVAKKLYPHIHNTDR